MVQLVRHEDQISQQTRREVPCDMAVKWKYARVICRELYHHVSVSLQDLGVPPLRIVWIHDSAVPLASLFRENEHALAMKVHGVREG